MKLILSIKNINYEVKNIFKILAQYASINNYDYVKLNFSYKNLENLKLLKEYLDNFDIKLILTFKNEDILQNISNNIEIENVEDINNLNNLKDKYELIIIRKIYSVDINNVYNILDINNIKDINYLDDIKNKNIILEVNNIDNLVYQSFYKINYISISKQNLNFLNCEWSLIKEKSEYNNLNDSLNFINLKYQGYKKIIITGITGQDGSILAEYLLSLNLEKHIIIGTIRSISQVKHPNLKKIINNSKLILIYMELTDVECTRLIIEKLKPNFYINCAAQTIVNQEHTLEAIENYFSVNLYSPIRQMEFIRLYCPKCKYLSLGSSEEFGETIYTPQDLNHPFNPINIYGITKNSLHNTVKMYRNKFDLHFTHLILYNHESERRPKFFVTKKITKFIAKTINTIRNNSDNFEVLRIGNIFSKRDWSSTYDFVKLYWKILQEDQPDTYIISSQNSITVKDFIDLGFSNYNIKLKWIITDNILDSRAYYEDKILIKISKDFYREEDQKRLFEGNNNNIFKKFNIEQSNLKI